MRRFPLILALAAAATPLVAQTPPAAATAAGNAASGVADTAEANRTGSRTGSVESLARAVNINSLESGTLLQIINQAFDTNSDSINPENGTMSWKGHSYDMGQFRVFRGRFERYLSLPATRDQDLYAATLDQIFKLLSTRNAGASPDSVLDAWKLLYLASEYDSDGGNSLGVANQVFNAWRIRDEKQAFNITQTELQRIRRQQTAGVVYAGDVIAAETGRSTADAVSGASLRPITIDNSTNENASDTSTGGNQNNGRTNGGGTAGGGGNTGGQSSSRQIGSSTTVGPVGQLFRARELAETEAKIKALEAAGMMSVTQAKIQFQSQIISLFLQRRFQHALIASSFYRYIFKGSHQNLEVGKKELSAFLPSTDLAMTVETIEFLSREAINDVNSGMAAVRSNYDDNRKVAAIERLQETFFLGEYLPSVTQFEPNRKESLLTLYRKIDEARKLADLRDYDAVLKLTEEIGTLTADFRTPEVTAAVGSAQRMSTLSLNAAQQAAAIGDYTKAQEFVEKAAQLWPLNPAIRSYTENMASQADLGTQAAIVFDEAFKRDDFRRIYERRAELAVAFLNDNVRGPQLKAVIDRMARVEIYLAQTEELLAQNNAFSAWEALASATSFAPNDVVLNQRMAQLAPRVADFVGRLDKAKRYEDEGRFAASLTQFLSAQDLHPASQLARIGITRVSESIMEQLASEVPSAAPEK
jgi:tetratricopeptide (TPR) repeat protein